MLVSIKSHIARPARGGFLLMVLATVLGCGRSTSAPAVLRVGKTRIDAATVRHWEGAIGLGAGITSHDALPGESRRTQAVHFLISGTRVIEEATSRGLAISSSAVRRRVEDTFGDLSNTSKIDRALASTGRTIADAEFEARVTLASSELREAILSRTPAATEAEIAKYYRRHHLVLYPQERRGVDLIEQLRSRKAAIALANRLGPGKQFTRLAVHETVERPTLQEEEQDLNGHLVHAIFAAPIHRISGPVAYVGKWVIFVVRKVDRGPLGFPGATAEIGARLIRARRQAALKDFLVRYRREWRTKTSCRTGYVVPGCSESDESPPSERDPLSGA